MTDDEILRLAAHYLLVVRSGRRGYLRGNGAPPLVIAFARDIERETIERVAAQWDDCTYEGVGEDIDIGAAIRALLPAPSEGDEHADPA